jgi:hypothetical protein
VLIVFVKDVHLFLAVKKKHLISFQTAFISQHLSFFIEWLWRIFTNSASYQFSSKKLSWFSQKHLTNWLWIRTIFREINCSNFHIKAFSSTRENCFKNYIFKIRSICISQCMSTSFKQRKFNTYINVTSRSIWN